MKLNYYRIISVIAQKFIKVDPAKIILLYSYGKLNNQAQNRRKESDIQPIVGTVNSDVIIIRALFLNYKLSEWILFKSCRFDDIITRHGYVKITSSHNKSVDYSLALALDIDCL